MVKSNIVTLRKAKNSIMLLLCFISAIYGIFWLFWILITLVIKGSEAFSLKLLYLDPTPPGVEGGGLRHAFVGHFIIVSLATVIGIPIGIMAGIFFSEYGKRSKLFTVLRMITDILVSVPTIIVGATVYAILVKPLHHFNALSGIVALSIIIMPIVAITTNEMLKLVPNNLREAAYALGSYKWEVTLKVTVRAARNGILTGVLTGIARIIGETAPLLFTSFSNQYLNLNILKPMASLTVYIFNYVMGPYEYWHQQAWASALILTLIILLLFGITRLIIRERRK
ncbi:MAG: phosphate ABC transporter permease PstA [Thermosulfidibacteraceae bacterium]